MEITDTTICPRENIECKYINCKLCEDYLNEECWNVSQNQGKGVSD